MNIHVYRDIIDFRRSVISFELNQIRPIKLHLETACVVRDTVVEPNFVVDTPASCWEEMPGSDLGPEQFSSFS
jgi:hypothetical protein